MAALVLVAGAVAGCNTSPTSTESANSQPVVPKMGIVTEEIAGHQRLFSTFGFWMMSDSLKNQLLGCFRTDGTLDRAKLRVTFPDAKIVEGPKVVAVALSNENFTFFLLQDGPLISLDPKYDSMVQQMSVKAYTTP